jgi:tyrosine-protein kinase Etk/Wzc
MDKNQIEQSLESQERTLLEGILYYLSFLIKHIKFVLIGTSIAAIGSVLFSIITIKLPPGESPLPNYYSSSAVLIAGESGVNDMSSMLTAIGITAPPSEMNYGELGIRVLQSRPFLDTIVEENGITEKYEIKEKIRTYSRKAVLGNSTFSYDGRTGSLIISYEDTDPVFARDVVNSMVDNLQKWFQQWEGTSSSQNLKALEIKLEEVSHEIQRLEEEISRFQTEYGVFSVEQLAEAQADMINDLQAQLIQTEVALRNYSGFSTIQDQEYIQLQAQRDSLQELIQQVEKGQGTGVQNMPSREELSSLAVKYSHIQMNHEIQMRIFQNLKEQYEVQKLTVTSGTSPFSILEPAEVPEEKSRPRRSQICIIATLTGFLGSLGAALFIDLVRHIRNDPSKTNLLRGKK